MARRYEMRFELNGDVDPQLRRAFDQISRNMNELGDDMNGLRRSSGAFDELTAGAREFGDVFNKVLQFTGAHAIISSVTDAFTNMISTVGELDDTVHQMGAATGASVAEMAEFKDVAEEIYNAKIGESFDDIGNGLVKVRQVTGLAGEALEETTKNALIFRDVFEEDVQASIRAADQMAKQFKITQDQGYNLLAQGMQKGLNMSDELIDSVSEYSVYYKKLGFGANDMFNMFGAGAAEGVFQLDKIGDSIKELTIRTKDQSKTTYEGYEALGLNAEKFEQAVAGGGEAAKNATLQIFQALGKIEDPVKRNTAGVSLFGTQFEDLEYEAIKAMGEARNQFDMTADTMQEIEDVKYSSLTKEIQGLGRELMTELIIPIGEDLMPTLRDMTNWAKDNKELIKDLALAVPTALLAKNVISIGRSFTGVGKTVVDAASGAGKFSGAIGFLANPVGLAVGAVGALTLGVMAYKKHQEAARQELIHMGDELRESSRNYEEVADKAKTTNDLVWEYQHLNKVIEENTGKSGDLTYQKEKLAEVTEKLQELYPETITQYDIENGKLDEKVNLLLRASEAERDRVKLQLELQASEGRRDMTDLSEEITSLESQTSELQRQKGFLDEARVAFQEYENQYARIMDMNYSDDKVRQLDELLNKANETGATVGYSFDRLEHIQGKSTELNDRLADVLGELNTKSEELSSAESSYQAIYDAQKMLIELDLGSTIDEQASKYKTLSDEGKASFDKATKAVQDLNATMDLIPSEKKINIVATYQTIGKLPTTQDLITKITGTPMKQYADGGIANEPSIFGEAGPEIAIPLNNKPRSQGLLEEANRIMGRDSGALSTSTGVSIAFAPQYHITGADRDEVKSQVMQTQKIGLNELESMIKQIQRRDQRRNLA
ncbi:phage-related minor tail protein [Paenibacillus sp. DS2363]|uniref:phage tail tape measure protein n=1 Tax=Paenibacillus sp. DS2363 TaxID=3156427 RepID=UPI00339B3649